MLAKLKELGLERDTFVVFTSDNGPWYGGSTGGLRGMKSQYREGGVRVPCIARLPGVIPPGHRSDELAMIIDLFATTLALTGAQAPEGRMIDGKDIRPLLTSDARSPHQALFFTKANDVTAIRVAQWKYDDKAPGPAKQRVWDPKEAWVDPRGPDGTTILAPKEQGHPSQYPGVLTGPAARAGMLFNIVSDPAEQRDLSAEQPEVARRLHDQAMAFQKSIPRRPPTTKPATGAGG